MGCGGVASVAEKVWRRPRFFCGATEGGAAPEPLRIPAPARLRSPYSVFFSRFCDCHLRFFSQIFRFFSVLGPISGERQPPSLSTFLQGCQHGITETDTKQAQFDENAHDILFYPHVYVGAYHYIYNPIPSAIYNRGIPIVKTQPCPITQRPENNPKRHALPTIMTSIYPFHHDIYILIPSQHTPFSVHCTASPTPPSSCRPSRLLSLLT